jgi:hypothetical protein
MKNILLIAFCYLISWTNETYDIKRISVVNESVWEISAIHLSEVDKSQWSSNLLIDDHVLSSGGGAMIIKTECGTYDMKIIDSDSHSCIIKKLEVCGRGQQILITDQNISTCLR